MIQGLRARQKIIKRLFDLFFSFIGLVFLFLPILMLIIISTISTRKFGLYWQERVGYQGKGFNIFKVRTMKADGDESRITMKNDPRVTGFGGFLRKFKLDETPQLWNVVIGEMSLVGPRPDVPGYADKLIGEDRLMLSVKPGITGPATLKYRNEEELLSKAKDPKKYNDEVLWVDKVKINKEYIRNWSLKGDVIYLLRTIFN
ncbi:sugar transferase [Lutimonas zeaxanthinifaciens]|uniref:sugar transferase n=1 Tax=Lutimonas zeaxanthinifaciens TaxID=3060215 RepID=UPI00265CA51A|nr:sugar transferase [Lutimonas sp. YSD2104]WKK67200.1 sugar transferase [Lutimonas sp. YSD2104]